MDKITWYIFDFAKKPPRIKFISKDLAKLLDYRKKNDLPYVLGYSEDIENDKLYKRSKEEAVWL